jgi:hypothetical protein
MHVEATCLENFHIRVRSYVFISTRVEMEAMDKRVLGAMHHDSEKQQNVVAMTPHRTCRTSWW